MELENGAQVVLAGGCDYYPGSATSSPSFSFRATGLRVAGEGELLAQIERLRRKLHAEGLFEPQKALHRPALPRAIGVVTGERGKARDDVLAGLRRRGWAGRLVWAFAPVQDRRAAPLIARALQDLAAVGQVDAIVVARGGGSVMDLMAFSDETLCRTVAMLPVPVIASVGHHTDRTLIDDVASVSCSTPTHAAESAVRLHCGDARRAAAAAAGRLERGGRRAVVERARRLTALSRAPAGARGLRAPPRAPARARAARGRRAAGGATRAAVTRRRLLVLRRQSERLAAASGREDSAAGARRASCAAPPRRRVAPRRATSSGCRWRSPPTTPSARWSAAMRWSRARDGEPVTTRRAPPGSSPPCRCGSPTAAWARGSSRRRGMTASRGTRTPTEPRSYEVAAARIEEIIKRLDSGEAGLRETLDLVREGRELVDWCAGELEAVGKGLEELRLDELVARLERGGAGARRREPG